MLSCYHRAQLEIIYRAHDRLRDIPRDQWNDDMFYNKENKTSNMMGHYQRQVGTAILWPERITHSQYMCTFSHVAHAFDVIFALIDDIHVQTWDIYAMAAGMCPRFTQTHPYDRAMAIFDLIEDTYPRPVVSEKTHALT